MYGYINTHVCCYHITFTNFNLVPKVITGASKSECCVVSYGWHMPYAIISAKYLRHTNMFGAFNIFKLGSEQVTKYIHSENILHPVLTKIIICKISTLKNNSNCKISLMCYYELKCTSSYESNYTCHQFCHESI